MSNSLPQGFSASPGSVWNYQRDPQRLMVTARAESDIYRDPAINTPGSTALPRYDAVTLMTPAPDGDFQFQARVQVAFKETFDAGVLLVYASRLCWAKLCFEYSPDGEPMVVSVVNKSATSDDANAFVVPNAPLNLRISRKGNVYVFHAALENGKWIFVRAFSFDDCAGEKMNIGYLAQSPQGPGCEVVFSHLSLSNTSIDDFRDGK